MRYCVYYLYSKKLDKYYIGMTMDLERRIKEHFNSEELYTKRVGDWVLVDYIICNDSHDATILEIKLKKSKNRKYTNWYFEKFGNYNHNPG